MIKVTILRIKYAILVIWLATVSTAMAKDVILTSPNGKIAIKVSAGDSLTWSVAFNGTELLRPSVLEMQLADGRVLGGNAVWKNEKRNSVNETMTDVAPTKSRLIPNIYNELVLGFKGDYVVSFRAYDDGVAYRFETTFKEAKVQVINEKVNLNFPANYRVFWPDEADKGFQSHFESLYTDSAIADFGPDKHGALPMLLQNADGVDLLVSETDLHDYSNLFLFGTGGNALTSGFPKVIMESTSRGDRGIRITKLADYIAETAGARSYPWRTVAIAAHDKDLLVNLLNYKLGSPSVIGEPDWVKPGKVAWDWWNAWNIYGVDFKAGINTETYKYYIDFAAKYGLEYIMLDEGWTRTTHDLTHAREGLDIKGLIDYAASKGVGVWLWCLWNPLDEHMEEVLDQYAAWGAKGIKVDFMARADQYMVNFFERVASEAAKRKLMVDLHGAYKPVALHRKYPNVMSYEGVRGNENNKWENTITPVHNTTLPFTRMVAGPMDYTPGAMVNMNKKNFSIIYDQPMSMGTRAHQVAMYTLFESPLQMLADNPSNYLKEPECTAFIAQIPTVWDETVALDGQIGEYAAVARRNGDTWFIGAMNGWDARTLEVWLPFAKGKRYKASILKDGTNSDRYGSDYTITETTLSGEEPLRIFMNKGGGWSAILKEIE